MAFAFLTRNTTTSARQAYLYGLAGELLVLGAGAGLTSLLFGSVTWPVLILCALPLGIVLPCLKRGTRLASIPLVFLFSLFVALPFSYAWDNLLIFWILNPTVHETFRHLYQLLRFLPWLLILPLLATIYSKAHLGMTRLLLYSLFFTVLFALVFSDMKHQRIIAYVDPWTLRQNFDLFSVALRSFYMLLPIGLAEGLLFVRQQWRNKQEAHLRHINESLPPDDQETSSITKKDLRDYRDIEQFSAFFPERVGVEEVGKIVVYAHVAEMGQSVAEDALHRYSLGYPDRLLAAGAVPEKPIPRGSIITITPHIPGLRFEVSEVRLALWEDIQAVEFRFIPEPAAVSTVCRGWLTVWLDCARLADLQVAIFVAVDSTPEIYREHLNRANSRPYRRVFPSYSNEDQEIVGRFQAYAHAFGDKYLRDVMEIRAGETWEPRIMEFIRQADVFQLFWSPKAAKSVYVTREWQQALQERESRPDPYFLRPCFWSEKPALPIPPELQEIHFARIPHPL